MSRNQDKKTDMPLALKNEGNLELCFAGTGSAFAQKNYQTNFLLVRGDSHLLVDCGMTGPVALRKLGLKTTDIEIFLPSHSHADHVGGVECLALMNRYIGRRILGRPILKMIVTEEYQEILWNYTLRGGLEWNETGDDGRKLSFNDFFSPIRPRLLSDSPREIWAVSTGDLELELFRTKHIPEKSDGWAASFVSYGVFVYLTSRNDGIFISGDTRFDRELLDLYAPRSRAMFHDVQFYEGGVHANFDELRTLPEEYREKMYLVHYADDFSEQEHIGGFLGFAEQGRVYSW